MSSEKFSVRARIKSVGYALSGLRQLVRREHNARIHAVATLAAVAAGGILGISRLEWMALVIAIGGVWITELLNTCIERMADLITRERFPEIKYIKDLAAGAVLVAAAAAVITGLFIFIPKII